MQSLQVTVRFSHAKECSLLRGQTVGAWLCTWPRTLKGRHRLKWREGIPQTQNRANGNGDAWWRGAGSSSHTNKYGDGNIASGPQVTCMFSYLLI